MSSLSVLEFLEVVFKSLNKQCYKLRGDCTMSITNEFIDFEINDAVLIFKYSESNGAMRAIRKGEALSSHSFFMKNEQIHIQQFINILFQEEYLTSRIDKDLYEQVRILSGCGPSTPVQTLTTNPCWDKMLKCITNKKERLSLDAVTTARNKGYCIVCVKDVRKFLGVGNIDADLWRVFQVEVCRLFEDTRFNVIYGDFQVLLSWK